MYWIHRTALVVLVTGALAACQPPVSTPALPTATREVVTNETPAAPTFTPEPEPVIVDVYLGMSPTTIDPLFAGANDPVAGDLIENLFTGLTTIDPASGEVLPALAREWQQLEDKRTWQVFLRDDVRWVSINPQTGQMEVVRPVTASDVVFAVRRACSSEAAAGAAITAAFLIDGCQEIARQPAGALSDSEIEQMLGVRVLNDIAVEFRLTRDSATFPTVLAMPILRPVPADLVEAEGEAWTSPEKIWTNGPFALQPSIPFEEGATMVANQFWPLEHPGNVEIVQVAFNTDADEAYRAWRTGRLALAAMPVDEALRTAFAPGSQYRLHACPVTSMLSFSYDTAPLGLAEVRRGLALGLDREALVEDAAVGEGACFMGLPASSIIPPGTAGLPGEEAQGAGYQVSEARAELVTAGYSRCAFLPQLTLLTDDTFPASAEMAHRMGDLWAEALECTNRVSIEQVSLFDLFGTLRAMPDARGEPRPGLITLSWQGDLYDAQHWLADIIGCRELFPDAYLNQGRECAPADETLLEADTEPDPARRASLLAEANTAFFGTAGEMPVIPLYHWARPLAVQGWLDPGPGEGGPLRFANWVVDAEEMAR